MSEYIKTGREIHKQGFGDYSPNEHQRIQKDMEAKWVSLDWLIDKGRELCFCPECFAVMGCYEHLCEECRSRVAVPWDAEIFIQWLEKQVKEG
jgi:hypothetical protein